MGGLRRREIDVSLSIQSYLVRRFAIKVSVSRNVSSQISSRCRSPAPRRDPRPRRNSRDQSSPLLTSSPQTHPHSHLPHAYSTSCPASRLDPLRGQASASKRHVDQIRDARSELERGAQDEHGETAEAGGQLGIGGRGAGAQDYAGFPWAWKRGRGCGWAAWGGSGRSGPSSTGDGRGSGWWWAGSV